MNPTTLYGVVLAALLTGSYLAWTRDAPSNNDDGVQILAATADELSRIVYTSEKLDLSLEARKDDVGHYLWVSTTQRREERKPPADPHGHGHDEPEEAAEGEKDGGASDGDEPKEVPEPEPEIVTTNKTFKAGAAGDKLLEKLAPMMAKRKLDAGDDVLADMGLDAPESTLEIHREGKDPRIFDLGGETYGSRDRYIRDRQSGVVYLIDKELLGTLKRGVTALPDRELLGIETEDLTQVRVATAIESIEFEHINRDDPEAAGWRPLDEEEADESAGTWLGKFFKLRAQSYVQPDEVPVATQQVFAVTTTGEDGTTRTLEVLEGSDAEGKEVWYGRSDYTRELVKLHKTPTSQVAEDLSSILDIPAEEDE